MHHPQGLRERKKQRTRQTVQRVALELFATRGFRETTLVQIAAAADVSLRTVTVHFPAKIDLVLSLGFDRADALVERLETRAAGETTLDALRTWIAIQVAQSTAEQGAEDQALMRLQTQVAENDPELRARVRGYDMRIERALAAGIADDVGVPVDALAPHLAASAVVTGIRTITEPVIQGLEEDRLSPDEVMAIVDRTLDFARAGLGALTAGE